MSRPDPLLRLLAGGPAALGEALARRAERRLVFIALAMALVLGPAGLVLGELLGGNRPRFGATVLLVAWFSCYGLAMGLLIAAAVRRERTGSFRGRSRLLDQGYWLGDWERVVDPERSLTWRPPASGEAPAP